MPSVEAQPATVSSDAGWRPSNRERRPISPLRMLRRLLAGLNQLLKLSDFSRGDIFRD